MGRCTLSMVRNTICRKSCGSCGEETEDKIEVEDDSEDEDAREEEESEDGMCTDKSSEEECDGLKLMGNCNEVSVKNLCEKTCGVCFPDKTEVPCTDKIGEYRCSLWEDMGFCAHSKMRNTFCRKSCGACDKGKEMGSLFVMHCGQSPL